MSSVCCHWPSGCCLCVQVAATDPLLFCVLRLLLLTFYLCLFVHVTVADLLVGVCVFTVLLLILWLLFCVFRLFLLIFWFVFLYYCCWPSGLCSYYCSWLSGLYLWIQIAAADLLVCVFWWFMLIFWFLVLVLPLLTCWFVFVCSDGCYWLSVVLCYQVSTADLQVDVL